MFKNELKYDGRKAKRLSDYKMPGYDQRTSSSVSAGDHHGVGKRQPVGTEKVSSKLAVPQTSKCFSPDDVV